MSALIQFHPSTDLVPSSDLVHSVAGLRPLRVRLHPSVSPAGGAARLWTRIFQTLRTAAGRSPIRDPNRRSRSLPRGAPLTEVRPPSPRGGSQVQSDTAPPVGRARAAATPLPSSAPTAPVRIAVSRETRDAASLYCAAHRLRPSQFVGAVFRETLVRPGHRLAWLIVRLSPWAFARDRAFLAEVGSVRSMAQYGAVEERFRRWPASYSFLCGILGLRVSTHRVRRLVGGLFSGGR